MCRNPKLAAIFYRLKRIEAFETGLAQIMKAYKGISCQPKIEAAGNAFKITLPNRNIGKPAETQTGNVEKILVYLREHETLVCGDMDALLGVSAATSGRILKRMVEAGLIMKIGNGNQISKEVITKTVRKIR